MRYSLTISALALLASACSATADWDFDFSGQSEPEPVAARAAPEPELDMSPEAIHRRVFTLDTHVDIAADYSDPENDPGGFTHNQVDLPKMRLGGLDSAFFIVYVGQGLISPIGYEEAAEKAEDKYRRIMRMVNGYPERIELATTADEVEDIHARGKLVALLGMENSWPLGEDLDNVRIWAERGVRYVSVTHFGNNQFGGSSNPNLAQGDPVEDPGLTELGEGLIRELNDYGVMVDVSHVGKTTMLESIALSRAPVIASHSGAAGVYDHPRNLDDEQLEAIRDNGGVAQMVAFRSYIRGPFPEQQVELNQLAEEFGFTSRAARVAAPRERQQEYFGRVQEINAKYPDVTVATLVDHIDHAVSVAGIDHVGIVSDFDGGGGVGGWDDASETPNVTYELIRRGYSEDDIAKLWGGNVLRVMRGVEAEAIHQLD